MRSEPPGSDQAAPAPRAFHGQPIGLRPPGRGSRSVPPPSLAHLARERAEVTPGHTAYVFLEDGSSAECSLDFAALDLGARALAARLQADGAAAGKRALMLFPPGLDFVRAFFGCLYAGVLPVPVVPPRRRRSLERVQAIAADCDASWLLTDAATLQRRGELASSMPAVARASWIAVDEVDTARGADWREHAPAPDDLAFLQYTSGSTGTPKGVMVSHRNLLHNLEQLRRVFRGDAQSVVVGWLPLYHDMGLIGILLEGMYLGVTDVFFSPASFLLRPATWLHAVSRYGGTISGGPNFAFDLCTQRVTDDELAGVDLSSWKAVFCGSEPIRRDTLKRFAERFAPYGFDEEAFVPGYGMAEATLVVSGNEVPRVPVVKELCAEGLAAGRARTPASTARRKHVVSCGAPVIGSSIVIVDPATRTPLPDGRVGEIWFAGPSVCQGYWNRPDESESTFRARTRDGDGPYLRTGDLGLLAGGEVFVTGRIKDLVILRGENHYPQDLELTAERAHPWLRDAGSAAFAFQDADDVERLAVVAEVVRRRGLEGDAIFAAIRSALVEEHDAEPAAIVLLGPGALPKTSSGKVQRRATRAAWLAGELAPLAEWRAGDRATRDDAPARVDTPKSGAGERSADAFEHWLTELAAARLGVDATAVDPTAPLATLGLDSLAVARLAHRIETEVGVALPLSRLFEGASLRDLAGDLARATGSTKALAAAPPTGTTRPEEPEESDESAPPADHGSSLPLSYQQRSLWFLHRLAPTGAAYNLAVALQADAPLDAGALRRAIAQLVQRHPALRTSFFEDDAGRPARRETSAPRGLFEVVDATGDDDGALRARLDGEARRPFDLAAGAVFRVRWFERADGGVLVLAAHHIALDHWSLTVLLRELIRLYEDPSCDLGTPPGTYDAYVASQAADLDGAHAQRAWAYWRERLGGAPPLLEIPTDRRRAPAQRNRGRTRRAILDPALWRRVVAVARERSVTPYVVCLGAFEIFLARASGQERFLLGTLTSGRTRAAFADVIGYFVDPLVLKAELAGDPSFGDVLSAVQGDVAGALAHELPFARLVELARPDRDASRTPLFNALFAWQHSHRHRDVDLAPFSLGMEGPTLELGGVRLRALSLETETSQFDLSLTMARIEGAEPTSALALEYDTDLFDERTAARWERSFVELLAACVADPARPLSQVGTAADTTATWNGPPLSSVVGAASFTELFRRAVRADPQSVALVDGDREVSFAELSARARRLAGELRRAGVVPEAIVAVHARRGVELTTAILGILEAGAAWLPLDPRLPPARIERILADVEVAAVLVPAELARNVPPEVTAPRIALDEGDELDASTVDASRSASPGAALDTAAYVMTTSGSTGTPKAVVVPHSALLAHVHAACDHFELTREDRVLHMAAIGFDLSIEELLPPLVAGARVVAWSAAQPPSIEELEQLIEAHGITVVDLPTAYWHAWVEALEVDEARVPACVRLVISGGERASASALARWRERVGDGVRWVNTYGPTEATVTATLYEPPPGPWDPAIEIPIGRPIAGYRVGVVDAHGNPAPVGVPGELVIGGAGLARGYLGDGAATAARFVPDPASMDSADASRTAIGARIYRTGDTARWRERADCAEPVLEFLGRLDDEVKVRGFRVQPAELEAELALHPDVAEAAVVAHRDSGGRARLCAYVVARRGASPTVADLRDELARRVPDYLVPSALVLSDALPRTTQGKIDRSALTAPEAQASTDAPVATGAGADVPRSDAERTLAAIWCDVLDVARVGRHDDFFALGGDSIGSIQVAARAARAGLTTSPGLVFEHRTLAALARAAIAAPAPAPVEHELVPGDVPLTPIQRWFFAQDLAEPHHWNQSLRLAADRTPEPAALERALATLAERHDALRLRFARGERGWTATLPAERAPIPLEHHDLSLCPDDELDARTAALHGATAARLDLSRGPLLRATLLDLGARGSRLCLTAHHLVVDAVSWRILVDELEQLLAGEEAGAPATLPTPTPWSVWARSRADAPASSTTVPLPPPPRGAGAERDARVHRASVGRAETQALTQAAERLHATLEELQVCALARVLSRFEGTERTELQLEGHGRGGAGALDVTRTVGWFTTLRPVVVSAGGTLDEALRATKNALREASDSAAPTNASSVAFNFLGRMNESLGGAGRFRLLDEGTGTDRSPLAMRSHVFEVDTRLGGGELHVAWSYDGSAHDEATIAGLTDELVRELAAWTHDDVRDVLVPADFPLARLGQGGLDKIVARIRQGEER